MRYYIIKRLLLSIPTLFGITILTFLITRFVPGGPLEQLLSELKFSETEQQISHEGLVEEDLAYLKELYGLDKNWFVALLGLVKKTNLILLPKLAASGTKELRSCLKITVLLFNPLASLILWRKRCEHSLG